MNLRSIQQTGFTVVYCECGAAIQLGVIIAPGFPWTHGCPPSTWNTSMDMHGWVGAGSQAHPPWIRVMWDMPWEMVTMRRCSRVPTASASSDGVARVRLAEAATSNAAEGAHFKSSSLSRDRFVLWIVDGQSRKPNQPSRTDGRGTGIVGACLFGGTWLSSAVFPPSCFFLAVRPRELKRPSRFEVRCCVVVGLGSCGKCVPA